MYVCMCAVGYVLVVNVGASLNGQGKDVMGAVLCVVALAHVGLSMAFKFYFFQT